MARDRTLPSQAPLAMAVDAVTMVSETDPTVTYRVQLPSCTCPAFRYGRKPGERRWCKHLEQATARYGAWQVAE